MDLAILKIIRREVADAIVGRRFGRVFLLGKNARAIDLDLYDKRFLFIATEPADPRIYLIKRRFRDVEKASLPPAPFDSALKEHLSGRVVTGVDLFEDERVITVTFEGEAAAKFVIQLTGRSTNLFLVDRDGMILHRARNTLGAGQEFGTIYSPPERPTGAYIEIAVRSSGDGFENLSDALDHKDQEIARRHELTVGARAELARVSTEIKRTSRLIEALNADSEMHGDAERWKHFGDLLLANISTAKIENGKANVTDYFDESLSTISVEMGPNETISEAAERYFRKYSKARNAASEIAARIGDAKEKLRRLEARKNAIDEAIESLDPGLLAQFLPSPKNANAGALEKGRSKKDKTPAWSGVARLFISSDGYEIFVGKRAKDNDVLTFRVARSLDLWLHAADYPGSHVVVRNPTRKDIPHRTLVEAARLAAFYSQGNKQVKAAVHYTEKKFVNKRKGSAPGLVSLASFKTILVEPTIPEGVTNER